MRWQCVIPEEGLGGGGRGGEGRGFRVWAKLAYGFGGGGGGERDGRSCGFGSRACTAKRRRAV